MPLQPPSLNRLQSVGKRGYWLKRNTRDAWLVWIPPLVKRDRATGKIRLTVTRYYGGRGGQEMDEDNLVGGFKVILDLLKGTYIVDDRPELLELVVRQVKGLWRHEKLYPRVDRLVPRFGTLLEFEDLP